MVSTCVSSSTWISRTKRSPLLHSRIFSTSASSNHLSLYVAKTRSTTGKTWSRWSHISRMSRMFASTCEFAVYYMAWKLVHSRVLLGKLRILSLKHHQASIACIKSHRMKILMSSECWAPRCRDLIKRFQGLWIRE